SGGTVTGGANTTADYAMLNIQSNSGNQGATVLNANIGVNEPTAQAIVGGTISVLNNSAVASASGNNATLVIALNSDSIVKPTVGATNSQSNSAAITASVSNVSIGINAGATSSSANTVSGNHIGSVAIGNAAAISVGFH